MSHKNAKRARRLARQAGAREDVSGEYQHHVTWKKVALGKVVTERPIVRLIPGSFRSIVKKLKRGT